MKQYAFYFNSDDCIACRACVMACKDKNELKPGRKFRRVHTNSTGSWTVNSNGSLTPNNVCSYGISVSCNHCAEPACQKVCPAGAICKRADGIVFIDSDLCIGCLSCADACPYGAPSFNKETMKMEKCDFCRELLAAGELPACVGSCPTYSIEHGDLEYLKLIHHTAVSQVEPLPDPSQTTPSLLIKPHRKYVAAAPVTQYNMPEEIQAYEK